MLDGLWAVVLAAGAGRRLASLTGGIPKQFWRLDGGPTLLEVTLSRLEPLAPPGRTVIVVDQAHARYVAMPQPGQIRFQPSDRGTAAGVLFGLLPILALAPDAPVVMTPSDHGVTDARVFRAGIRHAAAQIGRRSDVIVFGVQPDYAAEDYGWITPDVGRPGRLRDVTAFVEKPPASLARRLHGDGALWNTMVIVARASSLLELHRRHVPEVARVFERALGLPPTIRDGWLRDAYEDLPVHDFSRDVLTPAADLLAYTWPPSLGWSDLGTPERLRRWLGRSRHLSHSSTSPSAA